MTRTIIAVLSPADNLDIEMNVQMFSDDNRVHAPVFRVAMPKRPLDASRMEQTIIRAATESFHVGGCHGLRIAYQSEHSTLTIYEIDFDSVPLTEPTALKYARI